MSRLPKSSTIHDKGRLNLRLSAQVFEAIGEACASRPGSVSRNTWIAEAIKEKLVRDGFDPDEQAIERKRHA
jgi:predicted HicB family RNase H-like nuclease